MTRILCFGFAAVIAATGSAQAGLFGFGSHRGCCDDDCCPEECCPVECCEEECCPDDCASTGCLRKHDGLFKRLFSCLKKKRHFGCCEDDCCPVDCCEDGCCEDGCGDDCTKVTYGISKPVKAAPVNVAPAPVPAKAAPVPAPAEAAPAPAPPQDPAAAADEYFPSRLR